MMDDNQSASGETPCDPSVTHGDEKLPVSGDDEASGNPDASDSASCVTAENASNEEPSATVHVVNEASVAGETEGKDSSVESGSHPSGDNQDSLSCYTDIADKLTTGCLKEHLTHIQHSKEQLAQLTESQRVLIETMQQENQKFGECQTLTDVTDIMDKAKLYLDKLTKIKKDMFAVHEKSAKLKKRALKIQQEKMKEELQREHQKEREFERERQLIAQPVKKADIKTPTISTHTHKTPDTKTSTTEGTSTVKSDTSSAASNLTDTAQGGVSNTT